MYRLSVFVICLFLLLGASYNAEASEISGSPLINDLQKGGYVLYIRHGDATVGEDQQELSLSDCSTQRNLSVTGKEQAEKYGNAIRKLNIPIHLPVEASPLCRTLQTAQIIFGTQNVKLNGLWINIYRLSQNPSNEDIDSTLQAFKNEVEKIPPTSNRVIVAHSFPPGMGLGEISSMETVIIKPLGDHKGYQVIGKLKLEDVLQLAGM
ncbi:histidine phosphatase family protein [Paenibacillus xylanilyticus]|uniref:Histidine phosphatase family protein n=1 Tax=Paenibacillus xylanilyticus TaxID=248903 RepID=A0A7Y6EYW8_9BACL|nr:histidine phosphatase family protein [Paenibacillus xylanilyticus]NUU79134.1 histidine phosphatase family protein [Paenibacillus xylanilyticus]